MLKIGDKIKLYRRSENTNAWLEVRDDKGAAIKGIIKNFSYSRGHYSIFALVSFKEDENVYSEELLAINSDKFKLIRY